MEGKTQETAAGIAGMSVRSARKWQRGPLPSETKQERRWRTRPDPFEGVWEEEIEPLLRGDPAGRLKATTIIKWLEEHHPGRFSASQLRTLQRRLQEWRALNGALPHQNRYPTKVIASNKMLSKNGGGNRVGGGISKIAKWELLTSIQDRYQVASKKHKGRILDEFIAVTGHHRKHGIRLLGQAGDAGDHVPGVKGRRIYNEAVRDAVILVWEASDRICGKRLKAALPHLIESMERHGHLDLAPEVRERLLAASAATLDRLLKPVRATVAGRRKRRRNLSAGRNIPVRTFADWNRPPPGFLEIDLVAHCGDNMGGSFIYSLVATDVCTGWTEAVPLLAREQSLVVTGLEAIAKHLPFAVVGIDADNDSVFINDTLT